MIHGAWSVIKTPKSYKQTGFALLLKELIKQPKLNSQTQFIKHTEFLSSNKNPATEQNSALFCRVF